MTGSERQRIRKTLIILSFLLYPATFAYISCPIITEAASLGIVTAGLLVFALLFVSSLVAGRVWCGYLCPSGGLQELFNLAFKTPLRTRKMDWLKYPVFFWIYGGLAYAIWLPAAYRRSTCGRTDHGISILAAGGIAAFVGPVFMIVLFTAIFGKRGFCHTFCPIAVLLIIGRKVRNLFSWPALHLVAEKDRCIDCKGCSDACPMSLDVHDMVRQGTMEQAECILCGDCIDTCPNNVITFAWIRS